MPLPPQDPQEAVEFYSKILSSKGVVHEIDSITVSKTPIAGKGDRGVINSEEPNPNNEYVKISFKNGEIAPLELLLKKKPLSDSEWKQFGKEVSFYSELLPEALSFTEQRDKFKDVKLDLVFPKCYHADEDMILLDNVSKRGFIITPITHPHTFYQAERIYENLGTFHAVTFAMIKDIGLEEFKKKFPLIAEEAVFLPEIGENQNKYWENVLQMMQTVLKCKGVEESEKANTLLQKYEGNIFAELCEQVRVKDEDLLTSVILGGIWAKNIFVKRDEEKQRYPAAVFIDMKTTRIGSPMLDVGSYMFCVADHIHLTNWKFLFDVYYEFLKKGSKALGVSFEWEFDDLKVLYIGKSLHALFRSFDYLMRKICVLTSNVIGKECLDFATLEKWLIENPDANEALSVEITSKIQQYELYLLLLAE